MATLTLHKFGILPEEEDNQVFTFILDQPQHLLDAKSVESTEVTYGGHKWSVVCMRKEDRYLGAFLKWRYNDGQSASHVSCKAKYTLTLIHRHDYADNKVFTSTQKFTTSQSLLGKTKFVTMDTLLDLSSGYLDDTGKRVVFELSLSRCSMRYEKTVDISPSARTRKNASGYYFDTPTFVIANHKWYMRVYPEKANASGLPAVYLYLSSKATGNSMEVQFMLNVGEDSTEILTYNFGEGAKFDGFGKTLPQALYNAHKLTSLAIGVEISAVIVYKITTVHLRSQGMYAPHVYKDYGSSYTRSPAGAAKGRVRSSTPNSGAAYRNYSSSLTAAEAFQDQEGNYWKTDLVRDAKKTTVVFDKGVHHFPNNKTKLLCWSTVLLSQDPERARDLEMESEPCVGYFSNFIDDKGYLMTFPVDLGELEEKGNPYVGDDGEILLRINFVSLQTIPIGMRSIPRFDFQIKHLLKARAQLQDNVKGLEEMREMSASRASLSLLDTSSRDGRLASESSASESGHHKMPMYKSYDSLDALSTGDMINADDDYGKHFYSDILRYVASSSPDVSAASRQTALVDSYTWTSRETFHGTREDVSTESGVTVSDESSLLLEARPSAVDMGKQKETIGILVKFLNQRLPLRITEILECGSVGTGTATRSRMDVDLLLYSPDLPKENQEKWAPPMLKAIKNFIQNANNNPDPFYPLPECTDFAVTSHAVQFTCGDMDVDVMLTFDWDSDEGGGYVPLYNLSTKQTTKAGRQWMSLGSARLRKKFVTNQPNEVKEVIKVLNHWRNCIQWKKVAHRPNSYLLALLVAKAVEELRTFDMKRILQKVGSYVLAPELSLSWSVYYIPDKYPVEFDPPTPLIRDPANPGVNVADSLSYWGQFRTEMILWLRGLGITVNGLGTS